MNMTGEEALRIVCDTAIEWAGEYGFSNPTAALEILEAVRLLRPESAKDLA